MSSSATGGVKPMTIAGRTVTERERLIGMTDEERVLRKQWLKDQILTAREPVNVPELYAELNNPLRRLYKAPLDIAANLLKPVIGKRAVTLRVFTGKFLMLLYGTCATIYYFKYNKNDWTRLGGWRVLEARTAVYEGDPGYPKLSERSKPTDYGARGFDKVNLNL